MERVTFVVTLFVYKRFRTFHSPKEMYALVANFIQKVVDFLKSISKDGIEKLVRKGVIKNTKDGYVDTKNGYLIGFYRTKGAGKKRYVQDWVADLAVKP